MTFTFKELSFTKLKAAVKTAMAAGVQKHVHAGLPTGYKLEHVSVVLKKGSIKAEVTITPLAGSTAAALSSSITTQLTSMKATVLAAVKKVPGIESAVADGKMLANLTVESSAPEVITVTAKPKVSSTSGAPACTKMSALLALAGGSFMALAK